MSSHAAWLEPLAETPEPPAHPSRLCRAFGCAALLLAAWPVAMLPVVDATSSSPDADPEPFVWACQGGFAAIFVGLPLSIASGIASLLVAGHRRHPPSATPYLAFALVLVEAIVATYSSVLLLG